MHLWRSTTRGQLLPMIETVWYCSWMIRLYFSGFLSVRKFNERQPHWLGPGKPSLQIQVFHRENKGLIHHHTPRPRHRHIVEIWWAGKDVLLFLITSTTPKDEHEYHEMMSRKRVYATLSSLIDELPVPSPAVWAHDLQRMLITAFESQYVECETL